LVRKGSQALDVPAFDSVQETTSSGSTSLRFGKVHKLTIGSEQFHDIPVALSTSDPAEAIGDGLLPTTLFQTLYVNNREGFVVFNPRFRKNYLGEAGPASLIDCLPGCEPLSAEGGDARYPPRAAGAFFSGLSLRKKSARVGP
jgi:hypothetical protein